MRSYSLVCKAAKPTWSQLGLWLVQVVEKINIACRISFGILAAFTAIFAMSVAFMTGARGADVFAATAAWVPQP